MYNGRMTSRAVLQLLTGKKDKKEWVVSRGIKLSKDNKPDSTTLGTIPQEYIIWYDLANDKTHRAYRGVSNQIRIH